MNRHTTSTRRVNDPNALRGRLLDAAAVTFHSRGYGATSMQDVMQAANATGGATYHHFPTKKALGLAVIGERVAASIERTWLVPLRSARTTLDGILTVFAQVIAELDHRGAVAGCPLNNLALELSLADPEFRLAVGEVFERWRSAIADRIREDQSTGGLEGADPDEFATFVVASYSGAMALAKTTQSSAPLKSCAVQLARAMSTRRPSLRRP